MTTNIVKCPECGTLRKVHGEKKFSCCGASWNIADCLVTPKKEMSEDEKLEDIKPVEIDLNLEEEKKKLPKRNSTPTLKKDDMVCPYCKGDIYATERPGIFYCGVCDRYLIEE